MLAEPMRTAGTSSCAPPAPPRSSPTLSRLSIGPAFVKLRPVNGGEVDRSNPDGNERLTSSVGLVLIVLGLAEIATLLIGLQTTLSWHVAIGLLLLPPVALKLATTGWRFARYYTRNPAYREKGPPQILMRAVLAPLLVLCTVVLFGSGVAMGFLHGDALHVARRLHGPASVAWMVLVGAHALVYLRRALRSTAGDVVPTTRVAVEGARRRGALVAVALGGGILLATATIPLQHPWLNLPSKHRRRPDRVGEARPPGRRSAPPAATGRPAPRRRPAMRID
jgi:hypothetical protein